MSWDEIKAKIVEVLRQALPELSAVYFFGSHIQGGAHAESDLDIAVLANGKLDQTLLWDLSGDLANIARCDVDLVDLCSASTVLQYQVITTGECYWARDSQAALYESFILSEKTELDQARAPLLREIRETGSVYGR